MKNLHMEMPGGLAGPQQELKACSNLLGGCAESGIPEKQLAIFTFCTNFHLEDERGTNSTDFAD